MSLLHKPNKPMMVPMGYSSENEVRLLSSNGGEAVLSCEAFYERLQIARQDLSNPFDRQRMEIAESVGNKLLRNRLHFADTSGIAHFGFWTRRSELRRLAEEFANRLPPGCIAQPRGLVFHIPPRNVETVFLYSWIISFLVGNANIVRLPSELSPGMKETVRYYIDALDESGQLSQLFVHYPAGSNVSAAVSGYSDARIVWGGDAKVNEFSRIPLRNGGKPLWFGDRFSLSVINGVALSAVDSFQLEQLANAFATDIFIFDQMACSSPQILYVVGSPNEHLSAVNRLMDAVEKAAVKRGFMAEPGHSLRKMVVAFGAIAAGFADEIDLSRPTLHTARSIDPAQSISRVGGGFLQINYLHSLERLPALIQEHYQTLSYFGFSRPELENLFPLPTPLGITRVVPIGEALNFDAIWDGYDLPKELTRTIKLV